MARGSSVTFPQGYRTFRQISVLPWDFLLTCVTFLCSHGIFCQLSVQLQDLPSNSINIPCHHRPSVNFSCGRGTFHQLSVLPLDLSTFGAAAVPSVNFHQRFVLQPDIVNFLFDRRTFCQLTVLLLDLLSTVHVARRHSVNFCHLSEWPG